MDPISLAADSLREAADKILDRGMTSTAFYPLPGNDRVKRVTLEWFENQANLDRLPFKIDIGKSRRNFVALVFPNRVKSDTMSAPDQDKCFVLIALEDLTYENGLMSWEGGPARIKKGDWDFFRSGQELELGRTGGGIAIWMELAISEES